MEVTKTNRNYAIEFFRFVFMLVIVVWHYNPCRNVVPHGYIAVEFFFLLSGALMLFSAQRHPEMDSLQYLIHRVKRFFPEYFGALLIAYSIHVFSFWRNALPIDVRSLFCSFVAEVSFLQCLFSVETINYPCWYLSALLIGGLVVYPICRIVDPRVRISALLFCSLIGFFIMFVKSPSIEQFSFPFPIVRAVAGLSLGAFVGSLSKCCHKQSMTLDVVTVVILALALLSIFTVWILDAITIVVFAILLFNLLQGESFFCRVLSKPIFGSLGAITYEMLILHISIRYMSDGFCALFNMPQQFQFLFYLVSVVIASYVFCHCFRKVVK